MSAIGQKERATQNRVVKLFQDHLGYTYLDNWQDRENNSNIEKSLLSAWLSRQGVSETLINRALRLLEQACALGDGKNLYDANREVYSLLRYGIKVKEGVGEQNQTIWLINWNDPLKNDFAIAEEVSIKGENKKRPDLVLYVNGIALGVLELKRSSVSVGEGIRQNIDNQKKPLSVISLPPCNWSWPETIPKACATARLKPRKSITISGRKASKILSIIRSIFICAGCVPNNGC